MTFGLGVAAALGAPFIMTIGFIIWEDHWKGSAFALNLFKCNLATIAFVILSATTRGSDRFPSTVFTREAIGYLILSSTIGIIIGDWTWLQSLQLLGARKVILMDSLKPFLAAVFGWLILGETLRLATIGGIALTVTGILVVSLEKTRTESCENIETEGAKSSECKSTEPLECPENDSYKKTAVVATAKAGEEVLSNEESYSNDNKPADLQKQRAEYTGYLMSTLNVLLDTYGSVLTKEYGSAMTVWEINMIRFGFAGAFMALLSLLLHCFLPSRKEQEASLVVGDTSAWYQLPLNTMTRKNWWHVAGGVALVTFLTPTMSNYALFQITLALALTLGSVGPLYALPLSYILQHNLPTARAFVGASLAVAGVVVLSFCGATPKDET